MSKQVNAFIKNIWNVAIIILLSNQITQPMQQQGQVVPVSATCKQALWSCMDTQDKQYLDQCLNNPTFQTPHTKETILHLVTRLAPAFQFEISKLIDHYCRNCHPHLLARAFACSNNKGYPAVHLAVKELNYYCLVLFVQARADLTIKRTRRHSISGERVDIDIAQTAAFATNFRELPSGGYSIDPHELTRQLGIIDFLIKREKWHNHPIFHGQQKKVVQEKQSVIIHWTDKRGSWLTACGNCLTQVSNDARSCLGCSWKLLPATPQLEAVVANPPREVPMQTLATNAHKASGRQPCQDQAHTHDTIHLAPQASAERTDESQGARYDRQSEPPPQVHGSEGATIPLPSYHPFAEFIPTVAPAFLDELKTKLVVQSQGVATIIDEQAYLTDCLLNPSFQSPQLHRNILHLIVKLDQRKFAREISRLLSMYACHKQTELTVAFSQVNAEGFSPLHLAAFTHNYYCFTLFTFLGAQLDSLRGEDNLLGTVMRGNRINPHSLNSRQTGLIDFLTAKGLQKHHTLIIQRIMSRDDHIAQVVHWPHGQELSTYCGNCYAPLSDEITTCPHCHWQLLNPDGNLRMAATALSAHANYSDGTLPHYRERMGRGGPFSSAFHSMVTLDGLITQYSLIWPGPG